MKYAYDNNGLSWRCVADDYVATSEEVLFENPPSDEQISLSFPAYTALKAAKGAQAALNKSDSTVIRCVSAGIPVPQSWQTYRNALRAMANGTDTTSTSLPSMPDYPFGT